VLEKIFGLKQNGTDAKTEVLAGATTFMAMAYILVVNPEILGTTGMDRAAVFTATALACAFSTFVMAFYANHPYALAPGMNFNSLFAFVIVKTLGYSWEFALTATLISGTLFLILALTRAGETLFDAIPKSLKKAVGAGTGFFIAFIGLTHAGIVKSSPATITTLGSATSPTAIVVLLGVLFTAVLLSLNLKGALLLGMIVSTVASVVVGIASLPPSVISVPRSIEPIFLHFDFQEFLSLDMLNVVFTLLMVHVFDAAGTVMGLASRFAALDEDGRLPRVRRILAANAVGSMAGAALGTSTVTTYVENASGMASGGRTGLAAFTTGALFLLALFFAPIFNMAPSAATAPALIIVGFLMMRSVLEINFDDFSEAIPAFFAVIMMPLTYSIADGIMFGVLAYVMLKFLLGKAREVSSATWIIAAVLLVKLIIDG